MSGYSSLGVQGQEYIEEEEYKALFGYPNGNVNAPFNSEVPGTSRPFIFQTQLYNQFVPTTAPTDMTGPFTTYIPGSSGYTGSTAVSVSYYYSSQYPYIKKYITIPLTNNNLSTNIDGLGLTWWYYGADASISTNRSYQVVNNILNQGIPLNYDPTGGYNASLYIGTNEFLIGNETYPWTYNVNSGIILFTGDTSYSDTSLNNCVPYPTDTLTFTFWRYEGGIGITGSSGGGSDAYWQGTTSTSGNTAIYYSNNVGIGLTNPTAQLDVNGLIHCSSINGSTAGITAISCSSIIGSTATFTSITGGTASFTTFYSTSDYRIKNNIIPLDLNTYNIDGLNPVFFHYKDTNKPSIGLIAHEVQHSFDMFVTGQKDGNEIQTVNYQGFIGLLIKEVQDLKERVRVLELQNGSTH